MNYVSSEALRKACAAGQPAKVKKALLDEADPNDADHDGLSALHHLAEGECERPATQRLILDLLLKAGANLNQMAEGREQSRATPICVAAQEEKWALVEAMAKAGACLDRQLPPNPTNSRSYTWTEQSVLCLTVRSGPTKSVKVLLDHGANVEDIEDHDTALTLAVWSLGNTLNTKRIQHLTATIELLIRRGASVTGPLDPNGELDYKPYHDRDSVCHTPLYMAVSEGCANMVSRLMEAGAWAKDYRWRHKGHQIDLVAQAINYGHPDALTCLFQKGVGEDWSDATWDDLAVSARSAINKPVLRISDTLTPERIDRQQQLLILIEGKILHRTLARKPSAEPRPDRPRL